MVRTRGQHPLQAHFPFLREKLTNKFHSGDLWLRGKVFDRYGLHRKQDLRQEVNSVEDYCDLTVRYPYQKWYLCIQNIWGGIREQTKWSVTYEEVYASFVKFSSNVQGESLEGAKVLWDSGGRAPWWGLGGKGPWSFLVLKSWWKSSQNMTGKLVLIIPMLENSTYFLIFPFFETFQGGFYPSSLPMTLSLGIATHFELGFSSGVSEV